METKKFLLASAAASGVLCAGGLVWYGLMRGFYKTRTSPGSRRRSPSLGIDVLARVAYGIALAASYPRSRSNAAGPVGRGFRTGVLSGALASVPSSLSEWGGRRMSLSATAATVAYETMIAGLAGAAVGSIYGDFPKPVDEPMDGYVAIDRDPAEGPVQDDEVAISHGRHDGHMHRVRR